MKDLSLGFIALFRQFLKWEWFTDVNTCHFMVYCLLRANKKAETWRGQKIKRGQFLSSLNHMSKESGLTISQIRTCINKLSKTGEIANETSNQNSIITIKKYNEYQGINKRIARILAKEIANEKGHSYKVTRQPIANDLTRNLATNNNDIDIYSNNIISLSNKKKNLSKNEREILKKYLLNKKRAKPIDDIDAYIALLVKNGDAEYQLERALKWQAKQEQKKQEVKSAATAKIEEIQEPKELTEQGHSKAKAAFEKLKKIRR